MCIQYRATIGQPAKRHSNGVSLSSCDDRVPSYDMYLALKFGKFGSYAQVYIHVAVNMAKKKDKISLDIDAPARLKCKIKP